MIKISKKAKWICNVSTAQYSYFRGKGNKSTLMLQWNKKG